MISCLCDIHDRIKVSCLTGGSKHRGHTAFQITDLGGYRIIGRILKTGIKISRFLQIKQSSHLLAARVTERSTLVNRNDPRFTIPRLVS